MKDSINIENLSKNIEIDYTISSLSFVLDGHKFIWSKGYWYFHAIGSKRIFYIGRKLPYDVSTAFSKFIEKIEEVGK